MANRLFEFYHGQELAANPETFLAGVVELFCHYPLEIIRKAASPVFGLPAKFKFPPRISEIREFLEKEMEPIYRARSRPKALPSPQVDKSKRPSLEQMKEKYGKNWGMG
jgi:hypothetical protein